MALENNTGVPYTTMYSGYYWIWYVYIYRQWMLQTEYILIGCSGVNIPNNTPHDNDYY